jgi:hypothetical protein
MPFLLGVHSSYRFALYIASKTLKARCDLVWPEHPEANDPSQYLHMNATLIAPLEGDYNTDPTRSVCTVRVFRQNGALKDAIGSHACSLEVNMPCL